MIDADRFRRGDPAFLRELLRTHSLVVLDVARAFGEDPDHVEDLFQQTWIRAYEKRGTYGGTGSFNGWLHRVVTRVCINDFRARRRAAEAMNRMRAVGPERESLGPEPSDEPEDNEWRRRLHLALARLSRRQNEVITLRILEDLNTDEVAHRLSISPATVRSNLRHGIQRLRRLMKGRENELS